MIRYYDKNTKKIIESLICNQKVSKKETANTINEMIEEQIAQYGLVLNKCIGITSDNAANMKKAFESNKMHFPCIIHSIHLVTQ